MQVRNPFSFPHPFLCHFRILSRPFGDGSGKMERGTIRQGQILTLKQSGPVVSYNRNDDIYKFVLSNVTLTLPPGQPNPMDGYVAPPPGRGKLNNPYDLTTGNDENDGGDDVAGSLEQIMGDTQLASSPLAPAPVTPTKRKHSAMAAPDSTAITLSKSAKPKGPQPLIITIPRLTIILYPSGFYKHHDTLPVKDRCALRAAAKQFDKEKMEELGLKKIVRRRTPRGPTGPKKKKPKTGVKVDKGDLDEDEDTMVGIAMQGKEFGLAPQQDEAETGKDIGWMVEFMEGESD